MGSKEADFFKNPLDYIGRRHPHLGEAIDLVSAHRSFQIIGKDGVTLIVPDKETMKSIISKSGKFEHAPEAVDMLQNCVIPLALVSAEDWSGRTSLGTCAGTKLTVKEISGGVVTLVATKTGEEVKITKVDEYRTLPREGQKAKTSVWQIKSGKLALSKDGWKPPAPGMPVRHHKAVDGGAEDSFDRRGVWKNLVKYFCDNMGNASSMDNKVNEILRRAEGMTRWVYTTTKVSSDIKDKLRVLSDLNPLMQCFIIIDPYGLSKLDLFDVHLIEAWENISVSASENKPYESYIEVITSHQLRAGYTIDKAGDPRLTEAFVLSGLVDNNNFKAIDDAYSTRPGTSRQLDELRYTLSFMCREYIEGKTDTTAIRENFEVFNIAAAQNDGKGIISRNTYGSIPDYASNHAYNQWIGTTYCLYVLPLQNEWPTPSGDSTGFRICYQRDKTTYEKKQGKALLTADAVRTMYAQITK